MVDNGTNKLHQMFIDRAETSDAEHTWGAGRFTNIRPWQIIRLSSPPSRGNTHLERRIRS